MEFIKALHRANHALVDAYEKSMKQQRMEKKQMREELKAQLARVRGPEVCVHLLCTLFMPLHCSVCVHVCVCVCFCVLVIVCVCMLVPICDSVCMCLV